MTIRYDETKKDLPSEQLMRLFREAGWSDGTETEEMARCFNAPFLRSSLVLSAWDGDRLVGAVRVLSDFVIRSVVYDLIVEKAYRNKGIGRELLSLCRKLIPTTEWLIQTKEHIAPYYERLGYARVGGDDVFVRMPGKYL